MHRCRKINLSHLPLLSYLPSDITENHVLSTRARKSIQITFFWKLESSFPWGNLVLRTFFSICFQFFGWQNWIFFENWNPDFLRGISFFEHHFQFLGSMKQIKIKLNYIWKTLIQISIWRAKWIEKKLKKQESPKEKWITIFNFSIF